MSWKPASTRSSAVNAIVVDGVQELVQTQVAAGKELVSLAQASFEKARADGIKAVAANPIAYIPEGKTTVVAVYNDSLATVTKTSEQLAKTVTSSFETITAKINGQTSCCCLAPRRRLCARLRPRRRRLRRLLPKSSVTSHRF